MANKDEQGGYIWHVPIKPGFVSEFFNHMVTYGGFSFGDGTMKVWGEPSVFLPRGVFVELYRSMHEATRDADSVFYWVGRCTGRNATIMLLDKFGFDKSKLPDFVNGATQDGFGYVQIRKFRWAAHKLDAVIDGTNSSLALAVRAALGRQKAPMDHYLCGILGGGAEPLFGCNLDCTEEQCMACGSRNCTYLVRTVPTPPAFPFFKRLSFRADDVEKRTKSLVLRRKVVFKYFQMKDIKFGDGGFVLRGVPGFNMTAFVLMLFDAIGIELMGKKRFVAMKEEMARVAIAETLDRSIVGTMSSQAMGRVFGRLEIFGLGRFTMSGSGKNAMIIVNENNPYTADIGTVLPGYKDHSVDFVVMLLRQAFMQYFKKHVEVVPTQSKAGKNYITVRLG